MRDQKKLGIVISYINITLNMLISVFFTPFLLSSLGAAEYGIYRIVRSFSGPLSIMSFGTSTVVARNIVYYDSKKLPEEKQNFLYLTNVISTVLMVLVFGVGTVLYQFIEPMYHASLTVSELATAKKLFILLILNIGLTIFGDAFVGIIRGHEKFVISYLTKTFKLVFRVVLIVILLSCGFNSIAIVSVDLTLTIVVILFDVLYARFGLCERPKFKRWDKVLIKTIFSFSAAVFLQAIVNQVNQNLDGIILGAMTNAETVAMYSLALTIFVTFNAVTNTISSVFAPQATRLVYSGATNEQLTDFVIRPGRIQFILAGGIISGFTVFGKHFIDLWVGSGYGAIYKIVLLLIVPSVVPIIISVSNALLDAKLLRLGRSIILVVMAVINLLLSIVLIHFLGYIGAAIGTAASYIIGYWIVNNLYIRRTLQLNIKRMYHDILKGILPCLVAVTFLMVPVNYFLPHTILGFILKVSIFLLVYFMLLLWFGFNRDEKKQLLRFIKKKK